MGLYGKADFLCIVDVSKVCSINTIGSSPLDNSHVVKRRNTEEVQLSDSFLIFNLPWTALTHFATLKFLILILKSNPTHVERPVLILLINWLWVITSCHPMAFPPSAGHKSGVKSNILHLDGCNIAEIWWQQEQSLLVWHPILRHNFVPAIDFPFLSVAMFVFLSRQNAHTDTDRHRWARPKHTYSTHTHVDGQQMLTMPLSLSNEWINGLKLFCWH